jgi:hypothetical protein
MGFLPPDAALGAAKMEAPPGAPVARSPVREKPVHRRISGSSIFRPSVGARRGGAVDREPEPARLRLL